MPPIICSISRAASILGAVVALFFPLDSMAAGQGSGNAAEADFLYENDQAMTKMMDGMSVATTGDVDHDFVAMMTPHHQGAIEMAQAELRYGHNEQLRRLAQEIVVEQQQEITAMRLALGQALPPSAPAPDQQLAPDHSPKQGGVPSGDGMHMNMNMNKDSR